MAALRCGQLPNIRKWRQPVLKLSPMELQKISTNTRPDSGLLTDRWIRYDNERRFLAWSITQMFGRRPCDWRNRRFLTGPNGSGSYGAYVLRLVPYDGLDPHSNTRRTFPMGQAHGPRVPPL